LQLLTKLNLSLGAKLAIIEINEFDRSFFVSINDAEPIFISHEVAKNILVKILA
jgi:DtxR family Mn-dependent transcriptional regulator